MRNLGFVSSKWFHLLVIAAGLALILTGAFHTSLWFDESYSVAIARHTFGEIWSIGSNDVHPVLFYWMLHVVYLVFGQNLTAYRLLTVAGSFAAAMLGFTHLRRDYGWKTGLLFSLILLFIPFTSFMAIEVRMYSWATFTVMLTWIYMMRIIRNRASGCATADGIPPHTWVIYALASLASAYLHYFSLLSVFVINLFLLIFLIRHRRQRRRDLIIFLVQAVCQVGLFVPWLFALASQLSVVSTTYWVNFVFPDTIIDLIDYPFCTRQIDYSASGRYGVQARYFIYAVAVIAIAWAAYLVLVIIRRVRRPRVSETVGKVSRNRRFLHWFVNERHLPGTLALGTYVGLIVISSAASLVLHSLMIYPRYVYVCIGPLIFFFAWALAHLDSRALTSIFCGIIITLGVFGQVFLCQDDYSAKNAAPIHYLEQQYQEGDLIVSSDIGFESITTLAIPDVPEYYLNWQGSTWGKAYVCYEPPLVEVKTWDDALSGFSGRIWILGTSSDGSEPKDVKDLLARGDLVETSSKTFYRPYDSTNYTVTCVERDSGQSQYQNYQTLLSQLGTEDDTATDTSDEDATSTDTGNDS